MNAKELLEILLQAQQAGIKLETLGVLHQQSVVTGAGEQQIHAYITDTEINLDYVILK
jgi:hypothetical protein